MGHHSSPLVAAAVAAAALLAGCLHPLGRGDVDQLTVCQHTDLAKIRKSLLLNGYEIKSESEQDLTTDWKQVGGYGRDREFARVTVVKEDAQTFRFKVRRKSLRLEKDRDYGRTVVSRDHKDRPSGAVVFDFSQPVEVVNEGDQDYYQEQTADYEAMQREVCGS